MNYGLILITDYSIMYIQTKFLTTSARITGGDYPPLGSYLTSLPQFSEAIYGGVSIDVGFIQTVLLPSYYLSNSIILASDYARINLRRSGK